MIAARICDGLWRWLTPHPDWIPDGTGADAWPRLVASVYFEAPDATVLIDPLVPGDADHAARFWRALDRDVERRGLPVATLRTVPWHERSCAAVRERYPRYPGLPSSITEHAFGDPIGERCFHLQGPRALVPGDVVLGGPSGGLRLCPPSWYDGSDEERAWHAREMRAALAPLLELDIAMVLCSHWPPVLDDASTALRHALQAPA